MLTEYSREIATLKSKLENIIEQESPDFELAIDILNLLSTKAVDVDILKNTGIGKVCNKLSKSNNAKVAEIASKVVEGWKSSVKAAPVKPQASVTSPSAAARPLSVSITACNTNNTPTATKSTSPPSAPFVPKTSDKLRNKIQENLYSALGEKFSENDLNPCDVAVDIENALASKFGANSEEYKDKYRVIAQNLRDVNNSDLNMRLLCGEITPSALVVMDTHDMASDAQKAKVREIDEYNKAACRSDIPLVKGNMTDEYKCGRCGQRKCNYYQKQTRSADEPMTTFITCTVCGKRWRD